MKPSTRQFLISAGLVSVGMALFAGRAVFKARADGEGGGAILEVLFFGVVLFLGIAFAWVRLLKDRKERSNRRSPLDLS